ncbi:A/G-specific adenine glycosylase [Laceyella tengchongensis]|uniref:A/G-specific adenine glycosylase n=1 Tax=Laceyella tengchongensis TaxID=574699 RepID=UPI0012B9EA0A
MVKKDVFTIDGEVVQIIGRELLDWYNRNRRDLPWRKDQDPYKIWVSEIMLQQTRVDTVIPYFQRFIEQFPTLDDLAKAPEEQVIKAWEGLGYYSRVKNLHAAVKEVSAHYGSRVPDDLETISKLKGIGPYTAGAVLSIAYNKKAAAVDGNVMRVFSRLFALTDDIALASTRKKMEHIALQLIPEDAPGDFNQALMELGALICTPSSPQCLFCPLQSVCNAYAEGIEEELPRKKKAKPPKRMDMVMLWLTQDERALVEKRPDEGLLAGMWGLPTIHLAEAKDPLDEAYRFCDKNGLDVTNVTVAGKFEHIFSHQHWKVTVLRGDVKRADDTASPSLTWMSAQQIKDKPFSNVYRKALQLFI